MPSSKPFDWNSWVAYVFPLKAVNMNFPAHEEIIWKMTAILADNVEEEYLWAISLTSANKVEQLSTQTKPWTPHTLSRTLSGTPKSLQELVMERVPITGMCEISVPISIFHLTIVFEKGLHELCQVVDKDCHLDARGPGWWGNHCGSGVSWLQQGQGNWDYLTFIK